MLLWLALLFGTVWSAVQPNIVLFLTDDQDAYQGSLDVMSKTTSTFRQVYLNLSMAFYDTHIYID